MRARASLVQLAAALCVSGLLTTSGAGASVTTTKTRTGDSVPLVAGGATGKTGYLVYWDQNEEEDFVSMPSGTQGQLLPAWDPNGQMCLLPDGRFVGGYDPTLPAQDNLGSAKPYKQPADGEELDEPNGSFSGQTLYVPGPYKMPGQTIGSDSPPTSNGVFNNNQTYTGCAVDKAGNVFGERHRHRPGPVSRRRAADGWWSGSLRTTRPTASSTDRPRGESGHITPTGRADSPSRG